MFAGYYEVSKQILRSLPVTHLIKECIDEFGPVLTLGLKLSIYTCSVMDIYKHAVVTPLLKKTNAGLEFKNYRPVSNLSFILKHLNTNLKPAL